ncbi:rhomboid family intramembrane serine protease [Marinobacter sp.]|uniref:rhomboid family intramembrane serine protease n=1 Tax=Marinobacter sp. TaxID=50741 RepID=UPI003566159B
MGSKKYCPTCKRAPLKINNFHGEEVDVCRQCGGVWFEKSDLDNLIAAKCDQVAEADYTQNLGAHQRPAKCDCPDCGRRLQVFHLLEEFRVDLKVCVACSGAWASEETVSRVVNSSAIKHALEEMNRKPSWKTWVFEFFLRMPVEYNVRARRTPWVTLVLIILNTVIFTGYAFDDRTAWQIIEQFAVTPAEIQTGQDWWTLVTATFLHGSWLHLAGNMYFLWVTGDNLEDALGHGRFLGLYLLCGVLAGLVSVAANLGGTIPSVGASGAIAGLFGMYLLWFPNASLTFMFVVWQKKLAVAWYFAIWLGLNLAGMLLGEQGVDYWAHIGGFITGLVIGAALRGRIWRANPLLAHLAGPEVQVRR